MLRNAVKHPMNIPHAIVTTLFIALAFGTQVAAERRWQTGTCTQVGINRTPFVSDVVHERMPPGFNKPQMTEVATYVIETDDRRYNLQAMVALRSDELAARVTVDKSVTIAVEGKTAYIKLDERDEREYRLLVLKNEQRK
jgi:hypothetical protein